MKFRYSTYSNDQCDDRVYFENLAQFQFQFSEMKQDERRSTAITVNGSGDSSGNETTVSLIVGGKTLYLFNLYDPENPIELAFQSR